MRKADNLPPSCAVVTKAGNLNFLEPSGPVQACNGTALPFFFFTVANQMACVSVARHHYSKRDFTLDILMSGRLVLLRRKRIV